jgi:hypothetical protein
MKLTGFSFFHTNLHALKCLRKTHCFSEAHFVNVALDVCAPVSNRPSIPLLGKHSPELGNATIRASLILNCEVWLQNETT